jgi:hypothetical protein
VISETAHTAAILEGKFLNPVFFKLRSIKKWTRYYIYILFSINPIFMEIDDLRTCFVSSYIIMQWFSCNHNDK